MSASGVVDTTGAVTADDLVDYEEEEAQQLEKGPESGKGGSGGDDVGRGNYVAIHASGFRDFFLKPELVRAIADAGFEHPSEVQHETIPHAITGVDILCQAKSGMGKTAVFVLSILQQLDTKITTTTTTSDDSVGSGSSGVTTTVANGSEVDISATKSGSGGSKGGATAATAGAKDAAVQCLGIAHTRELAFQIKNEFDRFSKYLKGLRCEVVYGGTQIQKDGELLGDSKRCPHVLIGTPGRLLGLIKSKKLNTDKIAHFVLDECDRALEKLDMRKDVQQIFMAAPKKKQVMFFSATMNKDIREVCRKFMQSPVEVFIDDESKLTLHGLLQYYIKLQETEKNKKLNDLLDQLEFNQVIIFVKSVPRAQALDNLLTECNFPSISIHAGLAQPERISRYQQFKNFEKRIMVATDLFGRGIDIERVNIVINYDMPDNSDSYLHRVGRAGRFGTKGLAITFVSSQDDTQNLNDVQTRFEVSIPEMPASIDASTYIN
eukprot:GHVS01094522.1.p1 GENE.GHVS01094522.1~~GHVS01094522.1.p1  ORF type:complete len:492 (-),score=81.62 GHVS01094522.1:221-1696(-)